MRAILNTGLHATSHTDAPVALPNLMQVGPKRYTYCIAFVGRHRRSHFKTSSWHENGSP